MTSRRRRKAWMAGIVALACAAQWATTGGASAQGAVKTKHGSWETRCETPPGASAEQCAVVQSVVDDDRPNITLVVIALRRRTAKAGCCASLRRSACCCRPA